MDKKEQQTIADELSLRLVQMVEGDVSELENSEKYKQVAQGLNSQPIAKRYLDFSIAYSWATSVALGMHYNVNEKNIICEAVFEKICGFLKSHCSAALDLKDYIKEEEELKFLTRQFAKDKLTEITISLLWRNLLEKRFFDYNNSYSGSFIFFPAAGRFYVHIFGGAAKNDFNSSALTSLFAGFLSKAFSIRTEGHSQREISKYTRMIEINPGYAKAYYSRAAAYFEKQEYKKSWQDLAKAKELGYEVEEEFVEKLKKALG